METNTISINFGIKLLQRANIFFKKFTDKISSFFSFTKPQPSKPINTEPIPPPPDPKVVTTAPPPKSNNKNPTLPGNLSSISPSTPKDMTASPDPESIIPPDVVDFPPQDFSLDLNPTQYPIILVPTNGTKIKFPQISNNGISGKTEKYFETTLRKQLNIQGYEIRNNSCLLVSGKSFPYEPDFAIINREKGIYIDVEIDEPYEGGGKKPIHYEDYDLLRNIQFIERGWLVIRFSEKQIHQNPIGCIKEIARVLNNIDNEYEISNELKATPDLLKEKLWSYDEATVMANSDERERYINEKIGKLDLRTPKAVVDINEEFENGFISELEKMFSDRINKIKAVKSGGYKSPLNPSPGPKGNNETPKPSPTNIKKHVYLEAKAEIISSGGAYTNKNGGISKEPTAIKNEPHRFHGGEKLDYLERMMNTNKSNFSIPNYHKKLIEKEYDYLKCKIQNETLTCKGIIQFEFCDKYAVIIISKPNKFPIVKIKAENHNIEASEHIHIYKDGSLCLYYPGDHNWNSYTKLTETIIPWISEWIIYYEIYLSTGIWVGNESPYHIENNRIEAF